MQIFVDPAPDGNPIGSGGGILVGNLLYLTLAHSQKHLSTNRETGVTHVELDKATLNGTFYQVSLLQNSLRITIQSDFLGSRSDATEFFCPFGGKKSDFLRLRADYSRNLVSRRFASLSLPA
jgi:hypothetical protein